MSQNPMRTVNIVKKLMKTVNIDGENLLNDLRNFNKSFRKDVNHDNVSQGFTLSLEDQFLEKPQDLSDRLCV